MKRLGIDNNQFIFISKHTTAWNYHDIITCSMYIKHTCITILSWFVFDRHSTYKNENKTYVILDFFLLLYFITDLIQYPSMMPCGTVDLFLLEDLVKRDLERVY